LAETQVGHLLPRLPLSTPKEPMASPDMWGRYGVTFALAVLFLAAQLLLVLHRAGWQWCLLTTARAAIAKLRTPPVANRSSEIEEAVHLKVLDIQLAFFRRACQALTAGAVANLVFIVVNTLSRAERLFGPWQDGVSLALFGILFFRQCWPGLLNRSTLSVWYSVLMAIATLWIAPGFCQPGSLTLVEKAVLPWPSLLSIARLDLRWVSLWQGVFASALLLSYALSDMDRRTMSYSAFALLCQCAIVVLSTGCISKSLDSVVRNEMEAGTLECKLSAGGALLRTFYDVVMELDAGLEITNPGELSRFLQSGPERSFKGTRLQDLLPDEDDRERFAEHMRSTPNEEESLAKVMNLMMSDGAGKSAEVELFSFQYKGPTGRSRHLIGLREFSDDKVPAGSLSGEEEHATASSLPMLGGEAPPGGPLWLQVEILAESLPVTGSSPALQRLVGLPGSITNLHALMDSPLEVIRWAETVVNQQVEGLPEGLEACANSMAVTLRPRRKSRARIQATCQVELSSIQPLTEDDDSGMAMPVVLNFQDARQIPAARRCRGEEGSSVGSADSRILGTERHADDRHVGALPAEAPQGGVQSL